MQSSTPPGATSAVSQCGSSKDSRENIWLHGGRKPTWSSTHIRPNKWIITDFRRTKEKAAPAPPRPWRSCGMMSCAPKTSNLLSKTQRESGEVSSSLTWTHSLATAWGESPESFQHHTPWPLHCLIQNHKVHQKQPKEEWWPPSHQSKLWKTDACLFVFLLHSCKDRCVSAKVSHALCRLSLRVFHQCVFHAEHLSVDLDFVDWPFDCCQYIKNYSVSVGPFGFCWVICSTCFQ